MAGKGKNTGKQSKNAKGAKIIVSYQKKERPKKETIMIPKSKAVVVDGLVDGKEILGEKRWFGKDYLILKNI